MTEVHPFWLTATPAELEQAAYAYQGAMFEPGTPQGKPASAYVWRFEPAYPLAKWENSVDSHANWRTWFADECKMWADEGQPDRYQDIVDEPIYEPVIAVEIDGIPYLWDGSHRVGGSVVAGHAALPAIIGTAR